MIKAISKSGELYDIDKLQAHQLGTKHLAVSTFVFSGFELLIQRRAKSKYHSGGLWSNSSCSHPSGNESLSDCAEMSLQRELGSRVCLTNFGTFQYKAVVTNNLIEHEVVSLFFGYVDKNSLVINVNPEEVSEFAWVDIRKLPEIVEQDYAEYTVWFQKYLTGKDNIFLKLFEIAENYNF